MTSEALVTVATFENTLEAAAVAGQALVFGVSHGYQGTQKMIVISILGLLYGILAQWRRNLRPGIPAHAWSDIFSALP